MVYVYDYKYFKNNKINFIKIFVLNSKTINNFGDYLNYFIKSNYYGIIIYIDKNSFDLRKFSFLKGILFKLHLNNKKISLIGLPFCIKENLFGGYDYIRLENIFFKVNTYYFNELKYADFFSSQNIVCKKCENFNSCSGLGILNVNLNGFIFRLKTELRLKYMNKIKFKDKFINDIYIKFINHIKNFTQKRTDRTLRYSNVFSFKNSNYDDRFVYYCRYLDLNELNKEYDFLKKIVINKLFLENIFENYYKKLKLVGFAYSIANIKNNKYRETFYVYFSQIFRLNEFLINEKLKKINEFDFMSAYFLGFDFFDNKFKEYKVYFRILNIDVFFNYLSREFNINLDEYILNNSHNYLFVMRFDINSNLISVKLELNQRNKERMKKYLLDEFKIDITPKNKYILNEYLAFDYNLKGKLNKITSYNKILTN